MPAKASFLCLLLFLPELMAGQAGLLAVPAVSGEEPTVNAERQRSPDQIGEEIVVTVRRMPSKETETPDNIVVITSKEIERMPAHDLSDVLSLVPGLDIQGRGSFGQPSTLTIQGSDSNHVRLMVDGVLINTQSKAVGNVNPTLIPIGNIQQVEVIKGSGSALWGSSLGGVVNVVTKSPPKVDTGLKPLGSLTFTSAGGAIPFWQEALELRGRNGALGYTLWNNHIDTDSNFRANSDFLDNDLSAKVTYDLNPATNIFTTYHYTRQVTGGFEFPDFGFGEDYVLISRYGTLGVNIAPSERLNLSATFKNSNQDSLLNRFAVPGDAFIAQVANKDVFTGLDIVSSLRLAEEHSVAAGADIGRDKLDSDQMAEAAEINRYGLYANYQWLLSKEWSLTAGGRFDDNQAYGNQFSPSGGVVWHLPLETHIKASAARAFNAPPLIYKYISGNPALLPQDDLRAERAWVYELSAQTKPMSDLRLRAGAYRAEVEDLVTIVEIVPFTTYQADNVAKARRQGLEAGVSYDVMPDLAASTGWELNRVQDRVSGAIILDNGVARTAYHFGLDYSASPLTFGIKGNYYFWNEPPANDAKDRRFIWDARVSYDLTKLAKRPVSAFVNLFNIFDRANWFDQNLPSPGRRVEAGLQYRF